LSGRVVRETGQPPIWKGDLKASNLYLTGRFSCRFFLFVWAGEEEKELITMLKRSAMAILIIIAVLSPVLPACAGDGAGGETAGAAYKASLSLTIENDGQEIVISMDEILKLDVIEKEVTPVPREDEEVNARLVKGVLLEDVFQEFAGISQKDPEAIRLVAGDGYSIEVAKDLLQTREIILAFELDGGSLEGWEKPLRAVVPDVFEMYWVKNLEKIEVVEARSAADIRKIIMMESRISYITDQEYDYYGESDRAVKISDLLLEFEADPENVYAQSVDGMEKNEKPDIFKSAYLKYTGKDSPMFLSEDLPHGMWIKEMLYFTYGSSAYFSLTSGYEALESETIEGINAVRLSGVISQCGLMPQDKYIFRALDNYLVEIESESIGQGYLYIQENGLPAVAFEGLDKNTKVKDLLYIGAAE
jgi:hypothetical protein